MYFFLTPLRNNEKKVEQGYGNLESEHMILQVCWSGSPRMDINERPLIYWYFVTGIRSINIHSFI